MKKLFALVSVFCVFFSLVANAATLDDKVAKVKANYEKRVVQIDNMKRATVARKEMLKEHARQNADLKIKQLKELETLKTVKKETK